jgi:hypothetical protein
MASLACRKPPPPVDGVASSRSGPVGFEEVERALAAPAAERSARSDQAAGGVEGYRKAAEEIVVQRAILAEVSDTEGALQSLGAERDRLYREAVLDLFNLEQDRAKPIRVERKEVQAYYDSNSNEFHRQASRIVYHLFRRDEDAAHPEATVAFLAGLKQRVLAGEPFPLLARQYSQSENRLMDGKIGPLVRGKLPKALDDAVFALPKGGVSDPVRVKGGAILLHVSQIVEEKQFPFEDVRLLIARKLFEKRRQERIDQAIGGAQPPEGSVVMDAPTLRHQLEAGDPAEVVLQIGARKVTVKDFKELLEKERPVEEETLPRPPVLERIGELYERLRRETLLYAKLDSEGFAKAPQRQKILDDRVRNQGLRLLVRQRMEDRIWKKVDAAAEAQKHFHQENRFLYQSRLRLKIKTLSVAGPELARKAGELVTLRESLVKGELDLAAAAQRIGGRVDDGGWIEPAAMALEPKVRSYLLEMNGTGYTVPFQMNRRMSVIFVEKRDEPRQLPYEEVKDRVRQDYHDRNQQQLYQEVVAETLKAQTFRFNEAAVTRVLAPTQSATPTPPPPA